MPEVERGTLVTTDLIAMQYFLKLEKDEKSPFILHFIDDHHMFVKSEKVQHLQEKFDEFLDGNTFEPTTRTR
jgi:hypothetical protein